MKPKEGPTQKKIRVRIKCRGSSSRTQKGECRTDGRINGQSDEGTESRKERRMEGQTVISVTLCFSQNAGEVEWGRSDL